MYKLNQDATPIGREDQLKLPVLIDQSVDDDLTQAIDLENYNILGIVVPSAWTTANIIFFGSLDNDVFYPIKDKDGLTLAAVVGGTNEFILLPLSDSWNFPRYVKIGTTVSQAADRIITLWLRC